VAAHFPELGIQSKKRKNLETPEDYDVLFEEYGRTVLKNEKKVIEKVADLTTERPSVLVCSEADPRFCHRTHLARKIQSLTELPIRDLGAGVSPVELRSRRVRLLWGRMSR
jgi:uncharacterized protein (DUF488 family)